MVTHYILELSPNNKYVNPLNEFSIEPRIIKLSYSATIYANVLNASGICKFAKKLLFTMSIYPFVDSRLIYI